MSRLWVVMRGVALLALLAVGLHLTAAPAAAEAAIPQGSTVHSATMSIYVSQASGQPVYLHRVTAPWEESTVTWNSFAGSYDGLVVGSFLADAVGWRTADLTALVQDWVNGTFPNYGVYMEQGLTSPFSLYSSSEYVGVGGSVEFRPSLTIVYTAPNSSQTSVLIKRLGSEHIDVFDAIISEAGPDTNDGNSPILSTGALSLSNGSYRQKNSLILFDFRLIQPPVAALGDRAWEDTNANGVQDDGEPGLAGVAVELYTCDGTFVAATVTDANGYYLFSDLTPGSYYVKFVTPDGYIITPANVGDDAFDSDIDGNGATACTELSSGETDLTVDAGFYKPMGQMCTLTPGYWKTHSGYGPAPYDDTWAMVGEDTTFFQSGQSWYQVLWTSPSGGNAYYILAHAYIAAYLNGLNGADTSAVAGELSLAQSLLGAYGPNDLLSRSVRQQFLDTAGVLDQYNNGYIGPGHCE